MGNIDQFTNADVIKEEADELCGFGCKSDGKFDELTFDGSVGDELLNRQKVCIEKIYFRNLQLWL